MVSSTPEFLNRIDETVIFAEIDGHSAEAIVRLDVDLLLRRLRRGGVELDVDDAVIPVLRERGFDPVYGARALRRTLRHELGREVAEEIVRARAGGVDGRPLRIAVRMSGTRVLARAVDHV